MKPSLLITPTGTQAFVFGKIYMIDFFVCADSFAGQNSGWQRGTASRSVNSAMSACSASPVTSSLRARLYFAIGANLRGKMSVNPDIAKSRADPARR
jgi:hypothetical protein